MREEKGEEGGFGKLVIAADVRTRKGEGTWFEFSRACNSMRLKFIFFRNLVLTRLYAFLVE